MNGLSKDDILLGAQCWNEKLAGVFYRLKFIEAYGTGIENNLNDYQGGSEMPLLQVGGNASKIILPNRNYYAEQSEALVVSTEGRRK